MGEIREADLIKLAELGQEIVRRANSYRFSVSQIKIPQVFLDEIKRLANEILIKSEDMEAKL